MGAVFNFIEILIGEGGLHYGGILISLGALDLSGHFAVSVGLGTVRE